MKRCPSCSRTYTDASLNFCLEDGTPLIADAPGLDPNATIRITERDTQSPHAGGQPGAAGNLPQTELYRQQTPAASQSPQSAPGSSAAQWSPMPPAQPRKKSNAVWWILGGVVVVGIIGVGITVMILALASMSSNSNTNANGNSNSRANRNSNANTNVRTNSNTNSIGNLPASLTDDFSEEKWGTGNYPFGDIWYANNEYHMRSKEKTYLVMYAPNNEYNTGNATVRVTARSVDGTPAASGFGLIVHGEKSPSGELEDYALLIYTGADPQYEIIKHKAGTQTTVIPWSKSKVIRSGTSPNQLEIRAKGSELSFYINGQYVDKIADSENFKRGIAGLYTSDTAEVAFDNLEIKR